MLKAFSVDLTSETDVVLKEEHVRLYLCGYTKGPYTTKYSPSPLVCPMIRDRLPLIMEVSFLAFEGTRISDGGREGSE